MSLQRMGLYRYATAYKKDKKKYYEGWAYWEDAIYIYDHYQKYLTGEDKELDELLLLWTSPENRREVDIYLYLMGFIKGVYKKPYIPAIDDLKDRWSEDKEQGPTQPPPSSVRVIMYTENSYIHQRNMYECPRNSSYYSGESTRISTCR